MMGGREGARQKRAWGGGGKLGNEGKHGVKDDWSETQLREVARKAAEDEGRKGGWRGAPGDGWRSEVAEAEMKY